MEVKQLRKISNYPNVRNNEVHDIYNPCFNDSRSQSFYNVVNHNINTDVDKRVNLFKKNKPLISENQLGEQSMYKNENQLQENQDTCLIHRQISIKLKKISQNPINAQKMNFQSNMAAYNMLERFQVNLLSMQKSQLVLLIQKIIRQLETLMLDMLAMQRKADSLESIEANSRFVKIKRQFGFKENKQNGELDDRVIELDKMARMSTSKTFSHKHQNHYQQQMHDTLMMSQISAKNNINKAILGHSHNRFSNLSGKTSESYQTRNKEAVKYPKMEITQSSKDRDLQIDVDLTQILQQMRGQVRKQMDKDVQKSCQWCYKTIPSQNQTIGRLQKHIIEKDEQICQLQNIIQQMRVQIEQMGQKQAEKVKLESQIQQSKEIVRTQLQSIENYDKQLQDMNNLFGLQTATLNQQLYNANVALQQAQNRVQQLQKAHDKILQINRCLNDNLAEIDSENQGLHFQLNIIAQQYRKLKQNQARFINEQCNDQQGQIRKLSEQNEELKQIHQKLEAQLDLQREKVSQDMDQVLRRCLYIQAVSFQNVMLK